VAGAAAAGEVLVSRIVVDLVAGSGLSFAARGEHNLKGVAGEWGLFAVDGYSGSCRTRGLVLHGWSRKLAVGANDKAPASASRQQDLLHC
jgi:hypothetical protein